uniref:PEHE domain-containing protein n=1 Tax=Anopheles dirus TaxID=7168 RepID=A0A182N4H8_9DIPT
MGLAVAASVPVKTRSSDAVEEMAPALTEPLSQSKLSSSAASGASPRTSSSTTTTATATFGGTTFITTTDNVHTELPHQQTQQLEHFVAEQQHQVPSSAHHHLHNTQAVTAVADAVDVVVTSTTTAAQHHDGATSAPAGGGLQVPGTAVTMSLSPLAASDGVGSTTVDDIQNNNSSSGGQGLKLDADTNRDLIELALEQLHQDATMGGGGDGCEVPVVGDTMTAAGHVIDMDAVVAHTATMPSNVLQQQQQQHTDLIPMELPPGQVILSQGTFVPDAAQHQQLPAPGGILATMPVQDPTQSSSSSSLGVGVGGTSELGMQLKETSEMDQMIRELSTADIDLLQVLKSFDNNSLLLFSDVDVANLCDVPVGDGGQPQSSPNKDRERLEQHAEIVKMQAQMQRKQDFLARRLSKLKARYMGQHVSEEIAGLFEYTQRYWKKREKENAKQLHHSISGGGSGGAANFGTATTLTGDGGTSWPDIIPFQAPPPDLTPEKLKPISANALKTFTKRLESVANTICSAQSKRVMYNRYFHGVGGSNVGGAPNGYSDTVASESGGSGSYANISNTIPLFEQSATQELEQTAGMLYAEMRQVQATIDSDATLSSSGGESADESMPYMNDVQEPLPITERAAWKWANDRAAVASKWTWVVARVADLEYRIRQHNEVLNKIRINKGTVTLEDPLGLDSQQQQSLAVNGYRGQLPGSSKLPAADAIALDEEDAADALSSCSRTRPYCRSRFRKRRLMQTHNLHTVSKKAAKPSNVKCGCQWPLLPCALCTGRTDPTAPREPLDTMTFPERVALLDASYHPVLSFPEDISHSIHLEAIMRTPEWQSKMIRSNATTIAGSMAEPAPPGSSRGLQQHHHSQFFSSGDELATSSSHGKRYTGSDGKRKYESMTSNKYKSNDRFTNDDGNKSKKPKSRRDGTLPSSNRKSGYPLGSNGHRNNRNNLQAASKSRKSSHSYEYYEGQEAGASGVSRSRNTSPNSRNERRYRNSSAYDISSIVIPQSMAATTRVSLPQYKDIAIPKWRIVNDLDDSTEEQSMDCSLMDCSDGSIVAGTVEIATDEGSKFDVSNPPNGTKTTVAAAQVTSIAASTSGYIETVQQQLQQQLIVMPAQDEEDISEDAIMLKHDRALQEERKKFRTYLKFPWSRPRAKRRTDSRAGSSGGNTPDPTSPAPPTPMVEHDSSPACPSTPLTPQDGQELSEANVINALNKSLHKKERRRTVSSKREDQQAPGAGNITPDTREVVSPYEPLQFPLEDNTFEHMLRSMPSDHLDSDCLSKLTGRNGLPFRRPQHRNNNLLLLSVKANVNLAPASLGLSSQNPLSSNASTATTLSATETDLEDFDDEDLMLAKRTENQLIMERLLNSRSESQQYEIVPPSAKPMLGDDDEDEVVDDEETDTGESLFVEEDDPNDPEWHDRPGGGGGRGAGGGNGGGAGTSGIGGLRVI